MTITLTYEIAMAAGKDAANASARAAGRTKWNHADYRKAVATTDKLMDVLARETGRKRLPIRTEGVAA